MNAAVPILSDLSGMGVRVRLSGEQLMVNPPSRVDDNTLATLREHRAELVEFFQRCSQCQELEALGHPTLICGICGYRHPRVRVLHALDGHRRTAKGIAAQTGLSLDEVYEHLGRLFDLGALGTDDSTMFWLIERE